MSDETGAVSLSTFHNNNSLAAAVMPAKGSSVPFPFLRKYNMLRGKKGLIFGVAVLICGLIAYNLMVEGDLMTLGLFTNLLSSSGSGFVLLAPGQTELKVMNMSHLARQLEHDPSLKHRLVCFDRIFTVDGEIARLHVPATFTERALGLFAAHPEAATGAVSFLESQYVVTARNFWSRELSMFNEIRRYRPGFVEKTPDSTLIDIDKTMRSSAGESCDFCSNRTAVDIFGSISGKHCHVVSNAAKYSKWHSLVLPKAHDLADVTLDVMTDVCSTMASWFKKIPAVDSTRSGQHHYAMWDYNARASASQPHIHIQIMSNRHFLTRHEDTIIAAWDYHLRHPGRNYWPDVVRAHEEVGLGIRHEACVVLPYLTPIKEKELIVLGPSIDTPCFARLWYTVIRVLREKYGNRAFSSAVTPEPSRASVEQDYRDAQKNGDAAAGRGRERDAAWKHVVRTFPAIARTVDRGVPGDLRSDVGAQELYGGYNVAADPFSMMEHLQEVLNNLP